MAVRIDTGSLSDLQTFGQLTLQLSSHPPRQLVLVVFFPMVGKMFSAFGSF